MLRSVVLGCSLLVLYLELASALLCYTCNYLEGQNKTCLLYPEEVRVTNCDKKYCTIMRQEAVNSPDRVISFRRGCEDTPQFLDKVVEDSDFKTYFRSCKKDKCNYKKGNEISSANSVGAAPNGIMAGKSQAVRMVAGYDGIGAAASVFLVAIVVASSNVLFN